MIKHSMTAVIAGLLALSLSAARAQEPVTLWTGGGTTGNWSDNNNWGGTQPPYGTLSFTDANNGMTNMTDDNIGAMHLLTWSGTENWTLNQGNGTVLSLYDYGGVPSKVENTSTGTVTINLPIIFAANNGVPNNPYGEINAINGDMVVNSNITLGSSGGTVYGLRSFSVGHTVTMNGVLGQTAGQNEYVAIIGGAMVYNAANTYADDTFVMNNGSLQINAGGSANSSTIRLGGDYGRTGLEDRTLGGTLFLGGVGSTGGVSVASAINTVGFNSSNALIISSQNTSGTNTLSGNVYLDQNLATTVAAGGTLVLSGAVSYQGVENGGFGAVVTVGGAGNTTISGSLTDVANNSAQLIKTGTGTLTLSGDNTTAPVSPAGANGGGQLLLNITGGTLSVANAANLGIPTGVSDPNKVVFGTAVDTSTDTLQANGTFSYGATGTNNVGFAINETSAAVGNTAVIDVTPGNTFTMNGAITDQGAGTAGSLAKSDSGTLILTAPSSYTGGTAVTGGTVSGGTTSYGTGDITVSTGAVVDYSQATPGSAGNNITGTGKVTINGDTGGPLGTGGTITYTGVDSASGGTTVSSGTLAISHAGGGALTGPVAVATGATVSLGEANDIQMSGSSTMTLAGGTLSANGNSDGTPTVGALGKLQLTGPATSTLDFGDAGGTSPTTLSFADSSGLAWTGSLALVNYSAGQDALYIGTTKDLSTSQLSRISFSGRSASQLPNGQITFTAAPEPSGLLSMLLGSGLLCGGIIVRRRRQTQAA